MWNNSSIRDDHRLIVLDIKLRTVCIFNIQYKWNILLLVILSHANVPRGKR